MRMVDIFSMLKQYFILASIVIIFVAGLIFILYKVFWRDKKLPFKKLFLYFLLLGYVVMVFGVTVLNRGQSMYGELNLTLFSSYKEAWIFFDKRHFLFLILNILMFVPLGILLPLIHRRWQNFIWLLMSALVFTLLIESFQSVTGYGIFDLDDILNNTIGAVIGYGVVMALGGLKKRQWKKAIISLLPLMMMIFVFAGMYFIYQMQEFGNLPSKSIKKQNITQAEFIISIDTGERLEEAAVYQAPSITKAEANKRAAQFFENIITEKLDLEIIPYEKEIIYWHRGEPAFNLWLTLSDQSFSFSEITIEEGLPTDAEETELMEALAKYGLGVPAEATFKREAAGTYTWEAEQLKSGSQMIDGSLTITYYADQTIKEINQQMITYEEVAVRPLKEVEAAIAEIKQGKFNYYGEGRIEQMQLKAVSLDYQLDSKGYYQPIYTFDSEINGEEMELSIPALAK